MRGVQCPPRAPGESASRSPPMHAVATESARQPKRIALPDHSRPTTEPTRQPERIARVAHPTRIPAMATMVGLTGGIGSGKSTVAGLLAERGAHVIDADRVAHEVYAPATLGFERIVERFGEGVLGEDGSIDRASLGALVFRDREALQELNAIVHPLVRAEVAARVADIVAEDPGAVIVIEAALMTETGWSGGAGRLWVVIAEPEVVLDRLVTFRDMDPDEVRRRMAMQADNETRRRGATRVIENNGGLIALEAEVQAAWTELLDEIDAQADA